MVAFVMQGKLMDLNHILLFQVQREEYHSGLQFVENRRILQVSISGMNIAQTVAEFYFWRYSYEWQEEIETNTEFSTEVGATQLHHIFSVAALRIARQVDIIFHTGHHVYFEIVDAVAVELDVEGDGSNVGLDFLYRFFLFVGLP